MNKRTAQWIVATAAIFIPAVAYADMGLPMLAVVIPGMGICIVPIIAIESWYIHRALKITPWRSVKIMTLANIESTIIGIPLTWILLAFIEALFSYVGFFLLKITLPPQIKHIFWVTIGAAWVPPYTPEFHWVIPTASLFLLIPFFHASYYMERFQVRRLLVEIDRNDVHKATYNANLASYGMLALIVLAWLIYSFFKAHWM